MYNLVGTAFPREPSQITLGSLSRAQRIVPAVGFFAFILLSAILAGWAPFELTITSVFLFAGLHNWIELRYFLSKLPSRLGPLKSYFSVAISGIVFLAAWHIAMLTVPAFTQIEGRGLFAMIGAWNTVLLGWLGALVLLRGTQKPKRNFKLALAIGCVAIALSWCGPAWLLLGLVYAHPLIGMWILDNELKRKPHWRKWYRFALLALPPLAVMIFLQASSLMPSCRNEALLWQLYVQSGGTFLEFAPPSSLVAVHAFLELLHYGVWLVAIPLATMITTTGIRALPIQRVSGAANVAVLACTAVASLAVVALWTGFSIDYVAARQFYFSIAIIHMLAEIPFLIRLL